MTTASFAARLTPFNPWPKGQNDSRQKFYPTVKQQADMNFLSPPTSRNPNRIRDKYATRFATKRDPTCPTTWRPPEVDTVSRQSLAAGSSKKQHSLPSANRTANAFFVPKSEIKENAFDLSINRYKEIVHEEEQYDSPKVILARMKKLEAEIASDLEELEAMLG